jgi:hypothetical protein
MASEMKHAVQSDFEKNSIEHVDTLDQPAAAVHTDLDEIDSGYWRSYKFLGTVLAIILLANSLFIGYVMPVSTIRHIEHEQASNLTVTGQHPFYHQ